MHRTPLHINTGIHLLNGKSTLEVPCHFFFFFVNEKEIENRPWNAAEEEGRGYKSFSGCQSLQSRACARRRTKMWSIAFLQSCQWIYPAIRHLQVAYELCGCLKRWALFTVAIGKPLTAGVLQVTGDISLCQTCGLWCDGRDTPHVLGTSGFLS